MSEYAELEKTHNDQVQFTQKSHPVPERVVQTLLELWQDWGCDHLPGEPVQCPTTLWGKNIFLISSLNPLPQLHAFKCHPLVSKLSAGRGCVTQSVLLLRR